MRVGMSIRPVTSVKVRNITPSKNRRGNQASNSGLKTSLGLAVTAIFAYGQNNFVRNVCTDGVGKPCWTDSVGSVS